MKKLGALILALALCLLPRSGGSENLLYMIDVGKGDAILLFAGEDAYLVDCGKSGAWENVEQALLDFDVHTLRGVFLTHTDKDHGGGLKKLVKSGVAVENWYASAYYPGEESEHPMVKALKKTGFEVTWLQAGDSVDGLFTVLAPLSASTDKDDDNSLVMLYEYAGVRVLLAGDMEGEEEKELLSSGADLHCDVFKVPNHADDDVCLTMDLGSLGASCALISTDPYDKPGTPDPLLLERLEEAGMEIYRTDADGGILVRAEDGKAVID